MPESVVEALLTSPEPAIRWQVRSRVLGALADLGCPPGDDALHPLRDRILDSWLHEASYRDVEIATKSAAYRHSGVPVMRGRCRAHASQQGYALWFLVTRGLVDDRCDQNAPPGRQPRCSSNAGWRTGRARARSSAPGQSVGQRRRAGGTARRGPRRPVTGASASSYLDTNAGSTPRRSPGDVGVQPLA